MRVLLGVPFDCWIEMIRLIEPKDVYTIVPMCFYSYSSYFIDVKSLNRKVYERADKVERFYSPKNRETRMHTYTNTNGAKGYIWLYHSFLIFKGSHKRHLHTKRILP